jgi:hypothetical protein
MMSRIILGTIKWFRGDYSLSCARSSPGTWPIILTFHYVHSLCGGSRSSTSAEHCEHDPRGFLIVRLEEVLDCRTAGLVSSDLGRRAFLVGIVLCAYNQMPLSFMCDFENGQCCEIQFLGYRESEGASLVINSRSSGIRRPFSVDLDRGALMGDPISSGDHFGCTLKAGLCLPDVCHDQV